MQGEAQAFVGSERVTYKELLAQRVWEYVSTGSVYLNGKRLDADTVGEWMGVVKWLMETVSPHQLPPEEEPEMVVRVIRENTERPKHLPTSYDKNREPLIGSPLYDENKDNNW